MLLSCADRDVASHVGEVADVEQGIEEKRLLCREVGDDFLEQKVGVAGEHVATDDFVDVGDLALEFCGAPFRGITAGTGPGSGLRPRWHRAPPLKHAVKGER